MVNRTLVGVAAAGLVAVAWMAPSWRSAPAGDAGGTAVLGVNGRASATPSIAASGDRVAIVWSAQPPGGGADVYAAVSVDGGRTFGPPVRVNADAGTARVSGEQPPRVAFLGPPGREAIGVLWTARGDRTTVRLAVSDDDGRTFSRERELQGLEAPGDRGWAALHSDEAGRTHAVWLDHRRMAPDPTATHTHHGTGAAGDPGDSVAMAQQSSLYYSGGGPERALSAGVCYCCKTAVASDRDGGVFIAWRQVYPGGLRDIAFLASPDGGRTFGSPVRVSEDGWALAGCPDDGPAMAVDAGGRVHVVWPTLVEEPRPHKAIFHAMTEDGRTFTSRARVSPSGRNASHPQIAVSPRGDLGVVWDEIVGGARRVFVARGSPAEGSGWEIRPLDAAASALYPTAVFGGDALVAAWTEEAPDGSTIRVVRVSHP